MKRNRRRLPIPQHEFAFTPDTFNLIQDTGIDGDRIARERAEADRARQLAEAAQADELFAVNKPAKNRATVSECVSKNCKRVEKNSDGLERISLVFTGVFAILLVF